MTFRTFVFAFEKFVSGRRSTVTAQIRPGRAVSAARADHTAPATPAAAAIVWGGENRLGSGNSVGRRQQKQYLFCCNLARHTSVSVRLAPSSSCLRIRISLRAASRFYVYVLCCRSSLFCFLVARRLRTAAAHLSCRRYVRSYGACLDRDFITALHGVPASSARRIVDNALAICEVRAR